MKTILAILFLLTVSTLSTNANAATYSCPAGVPGTVAGTDCTYPLSCPSGGTLQVMYGMALCVYLPQPSTCSSGVKTQTTANGSGFNFISSGGTQTLCTNGSYYCSPPWPYMNSAFNTCYSNGASTGWKICPDNSVYKTPANGGYGSYGECLPIVGTPICPSSYTLSSDKATCTSTTAVSAPFCRFSGTQLATSCYVPAVVNYQCNAGDTLNASTSTCQPPTLYATPTTHYSCLDKDANGVTDQLITTTTCRPDLLAYTGEPIWYCPVVAGDPDPIVAGTHSWLLDGSLQATAGYTVTGPLGTPIASSKKWVGGTTCSYQPPTVDAVFSFVSHTCSDPTYVLDASGMFCIPPKTTTSSGLSNVMACLGNDVLSGSTCTPALLTYSPTQQISYTCDAALPVGTTLYPATGICSQPLQTQPPTQTTVQVCGSNAHLNMATGMCDFVSIPAINVGGQYSCPALYTIGSGSTAGWCIPTAQWSYPATWNLTKYDCPDGGTLGLNASNQPNGLCYLP
ncbi:MAG: hypothetical protein PHQ60_02150 [Sideroxydans sp.]|nr:hypothetical protein [Sideroxydans sp.]MDD5056645.1 hypothetical protein [Sideroxydans sp.]